MAVRRMIGSVKSTFCSRIRQNKAISAIVAALMLLLVAGTAMISPHVKIQHKIDANSFLSPWDTRPAPPECTSRAYVVVKPAQIADVQAEANANAAKDHQTARQSKIVVASTSR